MPSTWLCVGSLPSLSRDRPSSTLTRPKGTHSLISSRSTSASSWLTCFADASSKSSLLNRASVRIVFFHIQVEMKLNRNRATIEINAPGNETTIVL